MREKDARKRKGKDLRRCVSDVKLASQLAKRLRMSAVLPSSTSTVKRLRSSKPSKTSRLKRLLTGLLNNALMHLLLAIGALPSSKLSLAKQSSRLNRSVKRPRKPNLQLWARSSTLK